MKKVIMFLLVAGTCTTAAVAQDSTKSATPKTEKSHEMKDCVAMKDGKVVVMKGTNVTVLDKDLTLPNGTTIKADGSVKMADGTAMQLKEGEALDMEGKLIKETPQK